ncbi:hypothetical protein R1flu_013696 [Riccia fluitans]|uniref:Uncharacterized protein n=1 Tax=Riccia fluitans TaxID=41844 RepID=A0ABD1YEC1_9MARC
MQVQVDKAHAWKIEIKAKVVQMMRIKEALASKTVWRPRIVLLDELRMKNLILDLNGVLLRVSKTSEKLVQAHNSFGY